MSYQSLPKEEIELFKQLPDLKVIFDVGSRDDTEYYDIYPDAEYHLFEPNLEFVNNLLQKVGDKGNFFINAFGFSDVDESRLYSFGRQAFVGGEAPITTGEVSYPTTTLDRYIAEKDVQSIDFLKIDAEGYDFKVLLGGLQAVSKTRFVQYEHWDNKKQYHSLLGEYFDMEYVGYRNVLCMNKVLVDVKTRNTIREYIAEHKLWELH